MVEYVINPEPETYAKLWMDMVKELEYGENPNEGWYLSQIKSLLLSGQYFAVTAIMDGETIGFSDVIIVNDAATGKVIGHGQHLYIKPEYRDGLIADKMFRKIEHLTYDGGAEILEIQCYPNKKRFWERQGFSQTQFIMRRN